MREIEMLAPLLLLLLASGCNHSARGFLFDQHQAGQTKAGAAHWSYGNQGGWPSLGHLDCAAKAQSPINIQRRDVIHNHQLKLHFYNYNQPLSFLLQNNHHTIKMQPMSRNDQLKDQLAMFGLKLVEPVAQPEQTTSTTSSEGHQGPSNHSSEVAGGDDAAEPEVVPATSSVFGRPLKPSSALGGRLRPGAQINRPIDSNHIERDESPAGGQQPSSSSPGEAGSPAYNGEPSIKLDWLDDGNNEFQLKDIHFHWGERKDNGSEHAIDGSRAAMEMHMVHVKRGLETSQIGITSDSITVIAFLIESLRKSNVDFNPVVNALTRVNMTNQAQEIKYKSLGDLLPAGPNTLTSFYTYAGSLTTPPCFQVVNWVVMTDRIYLNAKHIEMFRNLYAPPSDGHHQKEHRTGGGGGSGDEHDQHQHQQLIMPNIRQLQPLNNRTIMASFAPFGKYEQVQAPDDLSQGRLASGSASNRLRGPVDVSLLSLALVLSVCGNLLLGEINNGPSQLAHQACRC